MSARPIPVYLSPRPIRAARRRLHSELAEHVRASFSAVLPEAAGAALGLMFFVVVNAGYVAAEMAGVIR